ncbi:polysaccharide biosynthesis tyrosine autokinase [Marinilabiliaceae bacterium JC040]|nr:polysaccharide biosynthesis tyrosine autokinase [Marinilabiliaceae bacterium JC040]
MVEDGQARHTDDSERSIDLLAIFNIILSKWYLVLIGLFLGVLIAILFTLHINPSYDVKASVLLKSEMKKGSVDGLFENLDFCLNMNVQNDMAILKSYSLIREAIYDLNWRTSWYKSGFYRKKLLYKDSPFVVQFPEEEYILKDVEGAIYKLNPEGVDIHIHPVDSSKYKLLISGKVYSKKGKLRELNIDETVLYGERYNKDLFDFTIHKVFNPHGGKYFFKVENTSKLALNYIERLRINLSNKKSEVVNLSVRGESIEKEVDFINSLINVYKNWGLNQKNKRSRNIVKFIDGRMAIVIDSLRKASDQYSAFKAQNSTFNLDTKAKIISESLKEIDGQLFTARMEMNYYRNIKEGLSKDCLTDKMVAPSVVGIVDQALNALLIRLSSLFSKRSVLLSVSKSKNPPIEALDNEIHAIKLSISKNVVNLVNNTKININSLEKRRAEVLLKLKRLPAIEQNLINIKRNFDLNNDLYTFLQKRRAEAAIKMASNVSDIQVIDEACYDTAIKVGPRMKINLLLGMFLGMFIPIGFILFRYFMYDYIVSRKDLDESTTIPIYGAIISEEDKGRRWIYRDSRSVMAESFRTVKTQLGFGLKEGKVLSVNSVIQGEGKSHVSSNIATILALGGSKVVIVGCDLRTPSLHKQFDIEVKDKGLASYLIGSINYEDILQETECENLSVVLAGLDDVPNPAELLESKVFGELIKKLENEFDYVVIDNAPISLVADGLIVSKHANMNLFVVRQDYSSHASLRYIHNLMKKGMLKSVGLVFNGAKHRSLRSSYSSYGKYSYGYYKKKEKRRLKLNKYISKNNRRR